MELLKDVTYRKEIIQNTNKNVFAMLVFKIVFRCFLETKFSFDQFSQP